MAYYYEEEDEEENETEVPFVPAIDFDDEQVALEAAKECCTSLESKAPSFKEALLTVYDAYKALDLLDSTSEALQEKEKIIRTALQDLKDELRELSVITDGLSIADLGGQHSDEDDDEYDQRIETDKVKDSAFKLNSDLFLQRDSRVAEQKKAAIDELRRDLKGSEKIRCKLAERADKLLAILGDFIEKLLGELESALETALTQDRGRGEATQNLPFYEVPPGGLFERIVALHYRRYYASTKHVGGPGDCGLDVSYTGDNGPVVVQCKQGKQMETRGCDIILQVPGICMLHNTRSVELWHTRSEHWKPTSQMNEMLEKFRENGFETEVLGLHTIMEEVLRHLTKVSREFLTELFP